MILNGAWATEYFFSFVFIYYNIQIIQNNIWEQSTDKPTIKNPKTNITIRRPLLGTGAILKKAYPVNISPSWSTDTDTFVTSEKPIRLRMDTWKQNA